MTTDLNKRAREILRLIVDAYVETGEPVGSRAISRKPRPSDKRRLISSNRRTVMLRIPISSTPSCGPTKVAG